MADVMNNCMRVNYNTYRNFTNEKKVENHTGFVDGDLIESLADMTREQVQEVVAQINRSTTSEWIRIRTPLQKKRRSRKC